MELFNHLVWGAAIVASATVLADYVMQLVNRRTVRLSEGYRLEVEHVWLSFDARYKDSVAELNMLGGTPNGDLYDALYELSEDIKDQIASINDALPRLVPFDRVVVLGYRQKLRKQVAVIEKIAEPAL